MKSTIASIHDRKPMFVLLNFGLVNFGLVNTRICRIVVINPFKINY